jgi:hypothetical protein
VGELNDPIVVKFPFHGKRTQFGYHRASVRLAGQPQITRICLAWAAG